MVARSVGFALFACSCATLVGCSDTPAGPGAGLGGSGSGGSSSSGSGGAIVTAGGSGAGGGLSGTAGLGGMATGVAGSNPQGGLGSGGDAGAATGGAPAGGAGGSAGGTGGSSGSAGGSGVYEIPTIAWPSAECVAKVDGLIAQMTNAEKAAQLVMGMNPPAGSVTSSSLGTVFSGGTQGPAGGSEADDWAGLIDGYLSAAASSRLKLPIFYGIDAVHGASKTVGAVLFPHNAGLGSTRDPELIEQIGHATAIEAAAQGMSWTYAPSLSVSFDDRWGRVFESFSEDPELTGLLGAAMVLGLQGRQGLGSGNPGIVACGKHFAGDGQAAPGTSSKGGYIDRGDVQIDEAAMRKLGIAPYLPAIKAGIGTIMVSDARWNGQNMTGHKQLITTILKQELGFKGAVATDWEASSAAGVGGPIGAINAGVDVLMQPNDWQNVVSTISGAIGGQISTDRANDAVRRVLAVKCQAGLFGKTRDASLMSQVGSAEHRTLARRAVAESLVLLQNSQNALPLTKGGKFWVAGSGANSLERQCGGWSVSWQGGGGGTSGTTIRAAIGKQGTLVQTPGEADAAVVVLSEPPYAEFLGDNQSIDTLSNEDWSLLQQARASGKPVIALVVSGRPVLVTSHLAQADAWLAAWLPGTEGDGVADVLFGDHKPSGKLSHSWPKSQAQANSNFGDPGYDPQFQLGHGLSF
jgi:beta-glucosidase